MIFGCIFVGVPIWYVVELLWTVTPIDIIFGCKLIMWVCEHRMGGIISRVNCEYWVGRSRVDR